MWTRPLRPFNSLENHMRTPRGLPFGPSTLYRDLGLDMLWNSVFIHPVLNVQLILSECVGEVTSWTTNDLLCPQEFAIRFQLYNTHTKLYRNQQIDWLYTFLNEELDLKSQSNELYYIILYYIIIQGGSIDNFCPQVMGRMYKFGKQVNPKFLDPNLFRKV